MPEPREITQYDREQMYLTLSSPGGRLLLDLLQSEADLLANHLEDWGVAPDQERRFLAYFKAYRSILRILKSHQRQLVEEFRLKYDVEAPATIQDGAAEELQIVE